VWYQTNMGAEPPGKLALGKLAGFTLFASIAALVIGGLGVATGTPWWAVTIIIFAVVLGAAFALRRQQTGRWTYERRSWVGEQDGRSVKLVFDEKLVVLNRLELVVDGEQIDRGTIFYGVKELSGAGVTVAVGSGWIGECTGVVLCGSSGEERSLSERPGG